MRVRISDIDRLLTPSSIIGPTRFHAAVISPTITSTWGARIDQNP